MTSPTATLSPKVERSSNVTVVTLTRSMVRDVENVIARDLLGLAGAPGGGHLLLDFGNVDYVNSVELGTLVTLHKEVREAGGRLTLFNLTPGVFKLFTVTRLDTLLEICREAVPGRVESPPDDQTEAAVPGGS